MARKYDVDPNDGETLVQHFACVEHYDIEGVNGVVEDILPALNRSGDANSTNSTDGVCTPDGTEIWNQLKSLFYRCIDDRNNETACLPGCVLVASSAAPHDIREPFAGLDHEEATAIAPSLGFPDVSLSHLRCVLHMSQCQSDGRFAEEERLNYIWFSTAALILVGSRCTDCDNFRSMEQSLS